MSNTPIAKPGSRLTPTNRWQTLQSQLSQVTASAASHWTRQSRQREDRGEALAGGYAHRLVTASTPLAPSGTMRPSGVWGGLAMVAATSYMPIRYLAFDRPDYQA